MRPAQQLVAAVGDNIDSNAQAVENAGFAGDSEVLQVHQSAAAEVFHQRNAVLARQRHEFSSRRLLGEARDLEIRPVHAQQQAGALGDSFS